MAEQKLKILCLHGYRQSGESFRERTGALRKVLKKSSEFVFVTAPHRIPESGAAEEAEAAQFGWWFSHGDTRYNCDQVTDSDNGFQASIEFVESVFKEQGPFDGVLAFSQGASFLGMLCRLKHSKELAGEDCCLQFRFAILVAGFRSLQSCHQHFYEGPQISLPSLHVIGDTDTVIASDRSVTLSKMFSEPTVLHHPGGHFVPASSAQKHTYLDFLKKVSAPVS